LRKQTFETALVESVDMSPGGIRAATRVAGGAIQTNVLLIRHADEKLVTTHALQLAADGLENRRGHVFQRLGAENEIDRFARQLERYCISLDAFHTGVLDSRPCQIQRNHSLKALGQQDREMTIPRANVKRRGAGGWCQSQKIVCAGPLHR
jgi:hypothetical protein